MPQLDALRALAFIGVAVSHWTPNFLLGIVPWGTGVQLFFVLSGFLITGILLRSRPEASALPLGQVLKTFYVRRLLRIFPLYYGVLLLALLFSVGPIRETWPWHAAYLSNFHYSWSGHAGILIDPFLHLWSLSVEEQFYLAWPLIALLVSRRALPILLVASIGGSMLARLAAEHLVPGLATVRYLTSSCVDALAVGCLLACIQERSGTAGVRRLAWTYFGVGFAGLVVSTVLLPRFGVAAQDARHVGHTFLVIFYGGIVAVASRGFGGPVGWLLTLKPLLYLGKISYGLYVFHYFAPFAFDRAAKAFGWGGVPAAAPTPTQLLAYCGFTLLAAMVSWHFYELPLNRLKRFFPYPKTPAPSASRPAELQPT
jgi:peptidoglycan/LPS O-acetylase OafA/YrhL